MHHSETSETLLTSATHEIPSRLLCKRQRPNPYERTASRRAIACVTCARAKTKCDKSLPACSRCIAKGIRCDPRSTRRTSDHRYASTKRLRSNTTPTFPVPHTTIRAASFPPVLSVDQQAAMTQPQQTASLPEFPIFVELPAYSFSAPNECYTYTGNLDNTLRSSGSTTDLTGYCSPDPFSIATPEPIHCHQPYILGNDPYQPTLWEPWPEDLLAPSANMQDFGSSTIVPTDSWSTIESGTMMPFNLPFCSQPSMPFEQASFLDESPLHLFPGCDREYAPGGFSSLALDLNGWQGIENTAAYMTAEDLVTTVPLLGDTINLLPSESNWGDNYAVDSADTLNHYPEDGGYYLQTEHLY